MIVPAAAPVSGFANAATKAAFAAAATVAARLAATLNWSPDIFWASTPADLRAALGIDAAAAPPAAGADLARLMEAFPDGSTR